MDTNELIERLEALAERQRESRGDYLYRGQADPELSEAAALIKSQASRIGELEGERDGLRARLELVGDFADGPDGIECRDDTIKLLDDRIARLTVERDSYKAELEEIADFGHSHSGYGFSCATAARAILSKIGESK